MCKSLATAFALSLLCVCWMSTAHAQPLRTDFRQAANDDSPHNLGNVHWVQSILQQNNSKYYEGMSVPQRIVLSNVPNTPGNQHSLTFSHKASKGGVHAYDFLTSYQQALTSANAIVGPTVLQQLNECGAGIGPPNTLQGACNEIRSNGYSVSVELPDAMGTVLGNNVASRVAQYESRFQNRTLRIFGSAAISNASLTFEGYSFSGSDAIADYTLRWTSSSNTVLIEFAAHLALGNDVSGAGWGIGYGSGMGAGSISGGPYHVSLGKLDNRPLGSQDNQISSAAVIIGIECSSTGPSPVCAGTQNTYTFNSQVSGLSYSWSLSNNSSGASIVGSTTAQSVLVDAGTGPGSYTITAVVRDGVQTVSCPTQVSVNGLTVSATPEPILCNGHKTPVTVEASGGVAPYTGTGVFLRHAGTHSFTVTDSRGCSSTVSVTITEPMQLAASSSAAPLLCSNGTSAVTVNASGGRPPYAGIGQFHRGPGTYTFTVSDANYCVATTSVTIAAPPQLTVSATATDPLCYGGTATVTVDATGGTPPYSGTGTFTRGAGSYAFVVTDANGCTGSATMLISQPTAALIASATAAPILCFGGTSAITVSATGGTPPYSGIGAFSRAAGTYTFTVTDANGCTATTQSITLTQPTAGLVVTAVPTQILCKGSTATVTVSAVGGTPPYSGTGNFSRGAGSYTFTVTDANGCTATSAQITLTEPPLLVVDADVTPISCHGGSASVTITASGGTPPYTGTGTFALAPGNYSFTVTDANGCTATTSAIGISAPPQLTVSVVAPPILCNGGTSNVTITAGGGTPPYSGTGTFPVSAGAHSFTVTDANGCTATSQMITLTAPSALTASATAGTILCNGGQIPVTVTAFGGTPPYSGTGNFSRGAGSYTFTVTDANGCTATTVALTLTEPPPMVLTVNASPILCNGNTSVVNVSATGGTPPYSGTGTFNLPAGNYSFTVTDANGCTVTSSVTTLTNPAPLVVSVSAQPILCHGDSAIVTVTATGGTPPYSGTGNFTRGPGSYSFTVLDNNGCSATSTSISITQPQFALTVSATATPILCFGSSSTVSVSASGGTPPYSGTGNFNRTAGTYSFTVTDANGCTATSASINITQPPQLLVSATAPPILCNGNLTTVTVSASGGTPPYTGTGSYTRGAGSYTFTVTDANGCTATSSVTTILQPALLVVDVDAPPILCHGGTSIVTVSASGGTAPYTGTGSFNMGPGNYTFTVTDANGCIAVSAMITLTDPPALTATSAATPILCHGGTSTVTVSGAGGTPPYAGVGMFNRGVGTYTFVVTDANGCTASTTITITQPPLLVAVAAAPPLVCGKDLAPVTVSATGGVAPYNGIGTFPRGLGTHLFIVTDANGCTDSVRITVTGPPPLFAAANATPILCNGGLSTITVSAWGGTPPYTGVGSFQQGAGTYTFIVSDAYNCRDTVVVTLTEPPALIATADAPPILCAGGTTTVTVAASGGTPPYTGIGSFSRGPGTYTFVVTDYNGCTAVASVNIIDPPPLTAASSATPILCFGDTAFVTVTASGGTPPYQGTGLFPALAGTFTYVVSDSRGCSASTTITITQPPQLFATANDPSVACGRDSALVIIGAIGGTPPYSGVGNYYRTGGTHIFTVTDANGCTDTVRVTVQGPPPLYATAGATPILCNGGSSIVTISAWGGTPPYNGVGNFQVGAGTHRFVVHDANSCADTVIITIVEPPPLTVVCSLSDCINGMRIASAQVYGGTPPYSYHWMPFAMPTPTVDVPCNFFGTITLVVRDANWTPNDPNNAACEATCTINVYAKSSAGGSDGQKSLSEYALFENYPNPFNPTTTIRYYLPTTSHVRLAIYNTLGREIGTLVDAEIPAGLHDATWTITAEQGRQIPSGSYIYRLSAKSTDGSREFVQEKMMLLLK
ncbi:MAG: hypothetical protein M5R41_07740 [Bacteroidia bacterium]|nr:hypothetical protein [Bacteroidia bacterium]